MRFNMSDYQGKYAIHCATEAEAQSFIRCIKLEKKDNERFLEECDEALECWGRHASETCYNFETDDSISRGDYDWYKRNDYIILEWRNFIEDDFTIYEFTIDSLQNGDMVLLRNGAICFVSLDTGMLVRAHKENDLQIICLGEYFRNLKCNIDPSLDIVAVRRPTAWWDFGHMFREDNYGILVYEREIESEEG